MRTNILKRTGIVGVALALIAPAVALSPANAATTINVGVITATSGPLKSYGDAYVAGLKWGLSYYTNGTNTVRGGAKINLVIKDDGAVPDAAIAAFKDMVGNGTKIIMGTASSGVALALGPLAQQNKILYISGPAKNNAVTSAANPYVFRSGNNSGQDVLPLGGIRPMKGKKVILFVEDNAFGAGNIIAARAMLTAQGATFAEIKVPTSTTDFSAVAKQAADAKGAYIFIAWSNALTAGQMFVALKQQGAFKTTRPITGLAGTATYDIYGQILDGTNAVLTNSYFPGVVATRAADQIAKDFATTGQTQDLFTSDGVNAAQMLIQALKGNTAVDVDKAILNLNGFVFLGLKGQMQINATTHTLIQPMFLVGLRQNGAHYTPYLIKTLYKTGA